ncbi:hypothetical protein ACIO02_36155 [Streptomyces sp. NPDC087568]|uniref:hypothetical protein n=1 Tax=Streptomyces sp. NPDC087568 TaxID=3365799 RepID=UPI0037F3E3BD
MTEPTAARTSEFAGQIEKLAAFRNNQLQRQPSDRALAEAVGVSATTIGDWLRADRFPQRVELLLELVRAVQLQAEHAGLADAPTAAELLSTQRWRLLYQAEAQLRAHGTRAAVTAQQGRAVLERMRPGQPLGAISDPFHLEVHHAIDSSVAGLPMLPPYVPREHDYRLAKVVARAAAGESQIAVLVGGSSTGKTRACWETLKTLRAQDEPWRLWHPIDPSRPDAALAELPNIAPHTVVWLNEAQFYLAPDRLGEQVAAGLRNLLREPGRGPILVLATLWPEHWSTLTTRTKPDLHAHARELLDGHKIKVPDGFTGADLAELTDNANLDPRLSEAAENARNGQITQYLAGVPVLLDRYHEAPPATKALVHAAMDARRLGAGPRLPLTLLADAAPGYLTDLEWDQTSDDWLQQALEYTATACNGIPGILIPIKTGTPPNQRNRRMGTLATPAAGRRPESVHATLYRLADYLDQYGRRHRVDDIPPIAFWTAAASHAHPADLTALGNAAWQRGLYRDAAQLHKHAITHGVQDASTTLVDHLRTLHPDDRRPAQWVTANIAFDDPGHVIKLLGRFREGGADEQLTALAEQAATRVAIDDAQQVAELLSKLREVEADEQITALLARDPAAHVAIDDAQQVAELLWELREVEADEQITALLARDPATHVTLNDLDSVAWLLKGLREAEADEQVTALAEQAAAYASLDDPGGVATLLWELREAGADEQIAALLARDPVAHVNIPLDSPFAVPWLLESLRQAGADEQVTALLTRSPAPHVDVALGDPAAVAKLLNELKDAEAEELISALLARDPAAHVAIDDAQQVATLLWELREAGADEQIAALLARDPATHVALDDPNAVAQLLSIFQLTAADEQVTRLLVRDPATHVSLNPGLAVLLQTLREAGAEEQVARLLARDLATHADIEIGNSSTVPRLLEELHNAQADAQVATLAERAVIHLPLNNADGVAQLLEILLKAGADEQIAALLARDPAAHVALNNTNRVNWLLNALQAVGAEEQISTLIERLPAAGYIDRFVELSDHEKRYRFGREPDGQPAAPWTWEDLE